MPLFAIPSKVSLRLEKIQWEFLGGEEISLKKPHLVRWTIVELEKKEGVFGG